MLTRYRGATSAVPISARATYWGCFSYSSFGGYCHDGAFHHAE